MERYLLNFYEAPWGILGYDHYRRMPSKSKGNIYIMWMLEEKNKEASEEMGGPKKRTELLHSDLSPAKERTQSSLSDTLQA